VSFINLHLLFTDSSLCSRSSHPSIETCVTWSNYKQVDLILISYTLTYRQRLPDQ
jgi:hypothetical protein